MQRLYYSLKEYFAEQYHTRVFKITIDAGFTCPTRDGTKGRDGCLYCNAQGSGNGMSGQKVSVKDQVMKARQLLRKRHGASKFFLYYQAFSNTYADEKRLREVYDEGLSCDEGDIAGLIIGTRPDCISKQALELIASYQPRYEAWVEYGLQSMHQRTLEYIQRGHTSGDYSRALSLTRKFPIKTAVHLIVGLPHETREDILATVRYVIDQDRINAVKIHSLYVPRDSKLACLYREKAFDLMSREDYIRIVADILEILPDSIIISRLTGETGRENLLAPDWVLDKQGVINGIRNELQRRGSWQGKYAKGGMREQDRAGNHY